MTNQIAPLEPADRDWVKSIVIREWGADLVVVHQETFYPDQLPGFKTTDKGEITGLITYKVTDKECEIITLNSFRTREGIGTALIKAAETIAKAQNCRICRLVTTNNNLNAIDFYQKLGFSIVKVDRGAVNLARKIKPSIPLMDENGTPITDEITLEKQID
jgi:ribosomal protein S18 acetylase RimI-like enzyme